MGADIYVLKLSGSVSIVSYLHAFLNMTIILTRQLMAKECTELMEVNEDHLNENKQRLLPQSLLWQGSQLPSLAFAETKGRKGSGKVYGGNGEAQVSEQVFSVLCDSSLVGM